MQVGQWNCILDICDFLFSSPFWKQQLISTGLRKKKDEFITTKKKLDCKRATSISTFNSVTSLYFLHITDIILFILVFMAPKQIVSSNKQKPKMMTSNDSRLIPRKPLDSRELLSIFSADYSQVRIKWIKSYLNLYSLNCNETVGILIYVYKI